jgi:competence protein ComEC
VAAVAPQRAILSVGYRNRFNHPNPAVVQRYVAIGARLHRTDCEGALHVVLPGNRGPAVAVEGYAENARYWSDHEPTHLPAARGLRRCGAAGGDAGARR